MRFPSVPTLAYPTSRTIPVLRANRPARRPDFRSNRRAAFTLIEILTVLAIFSVVSLLMFQIITKSIELNRLAMGQLTQLITQGDLTLRFRTDVAAASGQLESLGTFRSGPETLILDFSPTTGPPPSAAQVIWQWDGRQLWRIGWDDDAPQRVSVVPEERYREVSFALDQAAGGTRVTARLLPFVTAKHKTSIPGVVVEALLGADRR
jgi:prepilin-type N-terminal cleavage/methylation domain-containing protein